MRIVILKITATLLLLCNTVVANSQNLLEIYNLAVKYDPTYRAAEATYLANRQILRQARGAMLPTVDATASKRNIDSETKTDSGIVSRPSGRADYKSTEYTLTITQPVFNAALFSGLKLAKATVRKAEAEYAAAQQDLIARVAEAYFGVLLARDNLDLAQAESTAIGRQLEVAKGRLEVGLATITDVHDARARYQLAQAQAIEARNTLDDSRQALREIVGIKPAALIKVSEDMPLIKPEPNNIEQWVIKARIQNFTLLAQREAVDIAKQDVRIKRSGHYPSLNIVGTRSRSDSTGSITGPGVRNDSTTVALELKIPLFRGTRTHSETKQAIYLYQAAQQQLVATERSTERQARSSFLGVSSGSRRVAALKLAVVASASALDAKQIGFRAGINTNLNVLDAQRDLYRAKRDYSDARYTYILNLLRLKQVSGTLNIEDIRHVNSWLDAG